MQTYLTFGQFHLIGKCRFAEVKTVWLQFHRYVEEQKLRFSRKILKKENCYLREHRAMPL